MAGFASEMMGSFANFGRENHAIITRLMERNKLLSKELDNAKADLALQISENQQLKYESKREREQIEQ